MSLLVNLVIERKEEGRGEYKIDSLNKIFLYKFGRLFNVFPPFFNVLYCQI